MSDLEEFKATFFQECTELLESMESGLLELSEGRGGSEEVNAVFRAVHSIKGGSGAFGFDKLVGFAHVFETTLDQVRNDSLEATEAVIQVLLRAGDVLSDFVAMARESTAPPEGMGAEVLAELNGLTGGGDEGAPEDFDIEFSVVAVADDEDAEPEPEGPRRFQIRFAPHASMYRSANEPLNLFSELRTLGELTVAADTSAIPELEAMDPAEAYIAWRLVIETDRPQADIEEIFEFVEGDSDVNITPEDSGGPASSDSGGVPPQESGDPPASAPETPTAAAPPAPAAAAPAPSGGPAAPTSKAPAKEDPSQTIRVELDRVDRVVNTVGELVITQAMINQFIRDLPQDSHNAGLERGLEEITQLTRELQESVMSIRAQPVKTVFSRMSRVVRELAQQTGKKLKLDLVGESTEVDKTVTERLSDPLTHMVRNAADHGIESPEERIAAGKPAEGTIRLSAEHKGGRIVIQLTDDGKGINRERVLQRARERGLVDEHSQLTDDEIDNLIFLPGFSTAETISNISGRGVGMDVVRRNVQDLGGRVSIKSDPGRGSVFQLTLPLTLAVMDGMVVRVGDETYIVPLSNIVECLRPTPGDVDATGVDGDILMLRGEVVPLAYLHSYFNVIGAQQDCTKGVVVVLEVEGGAKIGLVVDDLRGQQQVVIKSLEVNYGRVDGVAAATILGNGQVALILDVAAFGRLFQSGRSSAGASSDRNQSQAAVA